MVAGRTRASKKMTHGLLSNSAVFLQNGSLSHYKALVNCWSSEKVGCTVFSMASVDGYLFFFSSLLNHSLHSFFMPLCGFCHFMFGGGVDSIPRVWNIHVPFLFWMEKSPPV